MDKNKFDILYDEDPVLDLKGNILYVNEEEWGRITSYLLAKANGYTGEASDWLNEIMEVTNGSEQAAEIADSITSQFNAITAMMDKYKDPITKAAIDNYFKTIYGYSRPS